MSRDEVSCSHFIEKKGTYLPSLQLPYIKIKGAFSHFKGLNQRLRFFYLARQGQRKQLKIGWGRPTFKEFTFITLLLILSVSPIIQYVYCIFLNYRLFHCFSPRLAEIFKMQLANSLAPLPLQGIRHTTFPLFRVSGDRFECLLLLACATFQYTCSDLFSDFSSMPISLAMILIYF